MMRLKLSLELGFTLRLLSQPVLKSWSRNPTVTRSIKISVNDSRAPRVCSAQLVNTITRRSKSVGNYSRVVLPDLPAVQVKAVAPSLAAIVGPSESYQRPA